MTHDVLAAALHHTPGVCDGIVPTLHGCMQANMVYLPEHSGKPHRFCHQCGRFEPLSCFVGNKRWGPGWAAGNVCCFWWVERLLGAGLVTPCIAGLALVSGPCGNTLEKGRSWLGMSYLHNCSCHLLSLNLLTMQELPQRSAAAPLQLSRHQGK